MKKQMEEMVKLFEEGYEVVIGSYYGDDVAEDVSEIVEVFEEVEEEPYLYLKIDVDDDLKKVEIFIGNDE